MGELVYDSIVIGAGPAGLSAALQLARFNRQVALFDAGGGRSSYSQVNHNYLGFPGGVPARRLRELGREQLRHYPIALVEERVESLQREGALFAIRASSGMRVCGRTVVLASGVKDHFPDFPMWEMYVGRSIFWCIVCDGYSTRGKRLVMAGNGDEAAVSALQFLVFTNQITMVTNAARCEISEEKQRLLKKHGIAVVEDQIAGLLGNDGILGAVELASGKTLNADYLFSLQGCSPNSALAVEAGVSCRDDGFIVVNDDQQTDVPGLFAAGDVTGHLSHQIATAVHEGITAATAAQYHLYEPWQRHD